MSTRAVTGPVRADLQGLRAVAVSLVVVFHLWPGLIPGGFVGVDVFFVISGFLITAHLLDEVERSGSVRLGRFWARRARRLLPASLTVLTATLVASWYLAPLGDLPRFLREIAWSALYIENWALAGSAIDYLAAEDAPSPVQHFWSLSVEEQFYLVWPVLVLGAGWLAVRVARRSAAPTVRRRGVAIAIGLVCIASAAWSVVFTVQDPSPAYFATTTRAWEFAAGGLTAIMVAEGARRGWGLRAGGRTVVAWLGFAAIGAAAVWYSAETPFPALTAALPVGGTIAVMAAWAPDVRWSPTALLARSPIQWLGDRSYAVYLWHWPLIVFGGIVLARSATVPEQLVLLVITGVLAEVTTRFVERPIRFGRVASWRPRRVMGATALAMSVLSIASIGVLPGAEARIAAEQQRIETLVATPSNCLGAAELVETAACPRDDGASSDGREGSGGETSRGGSSASPGDETRGVVIPDASLADLPPDRCITDIRAAAFEVCAYGAGAEQATRTVALIGDSHAEQWLPAFATAAETNGWRLLVAAKSSCPFSDAERTEPGTSAAVLDEMRAGCLSWNRDALELLRDEPGIDTLVVSARARNPVVAEGGRDWREVAAEAYAERWALVPETIEQIVVLRDTPTMADDVLECLRDDADPEDGCARDRSDALTEDPQYEAALASTDPRVRAVDLSDALCASDRCSPVVGGVLAYRDHHHLSWVYAETLAPVVQAVLDRIPTPDSDRVAP
ncbi:acyltransferase [Plantibacter sp. MCCC 1A11337]|uniref:acyltransferase family protein n=1 Tax=Plantibacter sp. MCCC 1A11337 TaxID=2736644 RepID=UPI0015817BCA|nr:acyltransferase [Plantibacter sp. MCCC 1A11337]